MSSGENLATKIRKGSRALTWVGGEGGVALFVVEFEGVNAFAVVVEVESQVHYNFIND